MNRFLAAVRFLTIIPLPGSLGTGESALASSLPFFPLVGLLIGAVSACFSFVFYNFFAPFPAAVLTVILLVAASGGLHLDGLCDTGDGFFSSRSRDQVLAIMRDSRVGAMGVTIIVLNLLLKTAALSTIPIDMVWRGVLLMPMAGRCTIVLLIAAQPYARSEGGLATLFYSEPTRPAALWAGALLVVGAWLVAGRLGLVVSIAVCVGVFLFAMYSRRKIGGATGDTLGAGCELAETMTALIFAAQDTQLLI